MISPFSALKPAKYVAFLQMEIPVCCQLSHCWILLENFSQFADQSQLHGLPNLPCLHVCDEMRRQFTYAYACMQVRNQKLLVNGKPQEDSFILEQIKYEMKAFTVPSGQVSFVHPLCCRD